MPFVPLWMSTVAAELTSILRDTASGLNRAQIDLPVSRSVPGAALSRTSDVPAASAHRSLPFASLMLRGSRSGEAVAVLMMSTPPHADLCETDASPQSLVGGTPLANAELAGRLRAAALSAGVDLCSVSVRDAPHAQLVELLPNGTCGVIEEWIDATVACERLDCASGAAAARCDPLAQHAQKAGTVCESVPTSTSSNVQMLRLRVSPTAFFQTNTAAAELLYATIARASRMTVRTPTSAFERSCPAETCEPSTPAELGRFPTLVIDACCGGGAIGLWLAHQAREARVPMRVIGVELNAAAVVALLAALCSALLAAALPSPRLTH